MPFVELHGVQIEVPRMVKKPGEHKIVSTEYELREALEAGWALRLREPVDAAVDAELAARDADLVAAAQAESEGEPAAEPAKRKPGRPPADHAKKK